MNPAKIALERITVTWVFIVLLHDYGSRVQLFASVQPGGGQ